MFFIHKLFLFFRWNRRKENRYLSGKLKFLTDAETKARCLWYIIYHPGRKPSWQPEFMVTRLVNEHREEL